MTETTSIQHFTSARHTYFPVVRQPGLATFIAQAAVGSFCGSFLVLIALVLIDYGPYNGFFVLYVPGLMTLGLATGLLAGLLIWAASKEVDGQLLPITRSLIGVFVMGLAWFAVWLFFLREDTSSDKQLWLLAGVVVSGVSIGLVTNSRLRLWHELVRGGETKATLLKILAGFIGFVLRGVVVCSFLVSLISAITVVQFFYIIPEPSDPYWVKFVVWHLLALGHFATGTVVLFARMKFWLLVPLAVIAAAPVLANLWLPGWDATERNIALGYLGAWAMFLLTRWRQTDVAWSYIQAELRYYLID